VKCEQVRKLIEDYHDEELDDLRKADVAAHLSGCQDCRNELRVLEAESRVYEAYAARTDLGLELPPQLSDRIAARVSAAGAGSTQNRQHRAGTWLRAMFPATPWVRQALAAVLLVAVSVSGTLLLVRHYRAGERGESGPVSAGDPGDRSLETALKSIQKAEQDYLAAIRILTDIVEKQKSTLDPKTLAEVQANLKLIDEHIEATRRAYHEHPSNADLALYMLAAYSRKVELLQDLAS
jgi:hypothetical protein